MYEKDKTKKGISGRRRKCVKRNEGAWLFFILNLKVFTKTNYLRHYLQRTLLYYKDDTPRSIIT